MTPGTLMVLRHMIFGGLTSVSGTVFIGGFIWFLVTILAQ